MKKTILFGLCILFGTSPVVCITPTSYPDYVISLYEVAKSGYEQLVAKGYSPSRMTISPTGITAMDMAGLMPTTIAMHIDAFEDARFNGDDNAALFYKTASYANGLGDVEIAGWLNRLLAEEMAQANMPGWLRNICWSIGMAVVLTVSGLLLTFMPKKSSYQQQLQDQQKALATTYEKLKRTGGYAPPMDQALVVWQGD